MQQLARLLRDFKKHNNGWLWISLLAAAIILLPLLAILASVGKAPNENWSHITEYMLKDYVLQSVWLVLFTGILTVLLGVILAWLMAGHDFPLRKFFRWAMYLPLTIPPYIGAYTYGNMFSYTGTVQTTLRSMGIKLDQAYFDIMSMQGAVFIFTMFLFPYVYMITVSFLEKQSGSYIENARLLGRTPVAVFTRVVLPISRPAIVGGVTLVAFEVLSDYGVVNYYGIQTFTTAIFSTWFGMYDIESATRLAAFFMIGIVSLLALERLLRGHRKFSATTSKNSPLAPIRLKGISRWGATAFCLLVLAVSFVIPVGQLFVWAGWTYEEVLLTSDFLEMTFNTISVAFLATAFIMLLSIVVANMTRIMNNSFGAALAKVLTLGYSIPGAIVAIGVLSIFIWADERLAPLYSWMGRGDAPLILSLSLGMMVVAYIIRFTATGYNSVEVGFEKIGLKYMEASRMLGIGFTRTFFKVDLPLIKGALLSGTLLTFIEIVKELPLALLLRPFNFDTLATKSYQYASDERIFSAAVPSLFIIAVSLISIIVLHQAGKRVV
ncbi:ABC transporter permease [Cohnella panacarvi]|uniref:ABC transporter permease n=1 Tax=Cohnella panacarvi TaxID=400776 RepID=UPI00047C2642|nr:iron ABC transporter permease [Cohnella panacarvi]